MVSEFIFPVGGRRVGSKLHAVAFSMKLFSVTLQQCDDVGDYQVYEPDKSKFLYFYFNFSGSNIHFY